MDEKGDALAFFHDDATGVAMHGDTVEAKLQGQKSADGRLPNAWVTRVVQRANETIVGTFQSDRRGMWLITDDARIPQIVLQPAPANLSRPPHPGDKIVVRLEPWVNAGAPPTGRVIDNLGPAGAPGVDMESIIRSYNLPVVFPDDVLEEARAFGNRADPADFEGREDCRGQFVLTIDPDDAKDHDDATFVEQLADGWRLSVHIADVAHYVRPGTALDKEARRRGNSTYLPDRCLPMLPEELSAGLCSLHTGVERLAHTAFIEFSTEGQIRHVRFAKTVIKVAEGLTYKKAIVMLRNTEPGAVQEQVRLAWQLAAILRRNRFAAGSLDLDFPEVKVGLDAEGHAISLERVVNDESHQLIEEFMLSANEVVAREIKHRDVPAVYRIHDKPDPERLDEYRMFAAAQGYRVGDLKVRGEVQKLLTMIRGKSDEYRVKVELLKSLRRAAYSVDPIGHYGLAKVNYTHFTSPIRRYADLVVHRVLGRERLGAEASRKALSETAEHISTTERNSASAEKDAVTVKKLDFFQRQLETIPPVEFDAIITDVKPMGLLVELPAADMTGFIQSTTLPGGYYDFDRVRLRFHDRKTNKAYTIGDKIKVIVGSVDTWRKNVDFVPVG